MTENKAVVMFRCTLGEKRMLKTLAAKHYTNVKCLVLGLAQELEREEEEKKVGWGVSGNDYFNRAD